MQTLCTGDRKITVEVNGEFKNELHNNGNYLLECPAHKSTCFFFVCFVFLAFTPVFKKKKKVWAGSQSVVKAFILFRILKPCPHGNYNVIDERKHFLRTCH